MKRVLVFALLVSSCGEVFGPPENMTLPPGMTRPMARPGGSAAPPEGAVTADDFDTTTEAERAVAVAASDPADEVRLGRTVAALGSPADPGFWLDTPLVDAPRPGRVVAVANGKSVKVTLRPIDAPEGAGSRISLAALKLLEVGLAGLHQLDVYAR